MSRVVILTEIISPYRIPVFNALARERGIDLHVIFLAETDPRLRQWRVYKEEIRFSYEVLPSRRMRLAGHNLLLNSGLAAALRRSAPEVILCGGYNYLASWQCLRWAKRHKVRFLAWVESTAHDMRANRTVTESLKTKFLRRCDGFVAPGRSSMEYLKAYGIEESGIHFAPNAVDTDFFSHRADCARGQSARLQHELRLPSRFFLFVGRFVPEKGIFDLLQAYGTLAAQLRTEVGVVLVGDGPSRSELGKMAAAIHPGSIHFAGFAQRELLPSYYGLADAFVFPTHSDPWGLVVNEAMACGLPVIATGVAGCAADLVEDNRNGFVIPARDIGSLSVAMDRLARDPGLRLQMGRCSRERIRAYSPEACARGMAEAFMTSRVQHG